MTDAPTDGAGCVNCETRGEPFFCGLSKKAASEHAKGEVIFAEGQPARGVYVLCAGRVKLYATSGEARALITDIALPGDVLGLSAAASGKTYEASAETLGPCRLVFVRRDTFLRLLDEHAGAWAHAGRQLSLSYRAAPRPLGRPHAHQRRLPILRLQGEAALQPGQGLPRATALYFPARILRRRGSLTRFAPGGRRLPGRPSRARDA
jgi:hypothetical protein